jgi:DNA replication protein DnaC
MLLGREDVKKRTFVGQAILPGAAFPGGFLRREPDGSLLARLARIDVLVIDDWAIAPLSELERRDFWEICEDRYQVRSTILTSQLPVSRWQEQIGDPTLADGILDRLVHNAHRIEMRGDSMRKNRSKPNT